MIWTLRDTSGRNSRRLRKESETRWGEVRLLIKIRNQIIEGLHG
jgi:hypothetical protein